MIVVLMGTAVDLTKSACSMQWRHMGGTVDEPASKKHKTARSSSSSDLTISLNVWWDARHRWLNTCYVAVGCLRRVC